MSKMSDYCREVESLSKETGYSIQYILDQIDAHENELAGISLKTGYRLTYILRQYVTRGFNLSFVSDINRQAQISKMGELAERYIRGEISTGEYFDKLDLIKQGRSA